ncbi:MAG: D-2-hydroxyacid dehydrogenase [Brevibacterium sp.]|uniref:D-2-hydroxyacid dehydrogenase n=1 Tax=Brevibacterium sp. TaxID=1701 RepID=UPI002647808C|nr:D-2-hydroxyacid dehydrogenase [Brevibacterium sp.]MDN5806761.1 D-2-hydroxyacid dehydrogenase [Brevibacterium sp.]MDN5832871.1 D-2-hydroxyacid dehydrogenase [Brevibacterium sp.]MDN5875986.1 D-2-hydroxyacid dehydrogenase [Brevibacterium sp.]MDN5908412.1 D-2-hydroxyacid dehydrogenase [Brevibacterium sp.]MDN6157130.1 D-2-hydroxyacid dehydrogenase [Brevibacterium sp.]
MTVLTILNAPGTQIPDQLTDLGRREDVELRIVEAEELGSALPGTDVLLLWDFFSRALRSEFGHADSLKWIHAAAAGVDSLIFDELSASEVVVTNARGIFDRPIAEFVLNYILLHAKNSLRSLEDQRNSQWNRRSTKNLAGSQAMIVGTGSIGREIARVLNALDVNVSGAGSHARTGDADFGTVIDSAQLSSHLSGVDWVINIAPLTDKTKNFIDAEVFAAMEPSAYFVNVGRGEAVVTPDLVDALETGQISGAGLDVFDEEPLPAGHPLWQTDNVIITPHMSGDTDGWRLRLADQFVDLFEKYMAGETFPHTVDKAAGYVR